MAARPLFNSTARFWSLVSSLKESHPKSMNLLYSFDDDDE